MMKATGSITMRFEIDDLEVESKEGLLDAMFPDGFEGTLMGYDSMVIKFEEESSIVLAGTTFEVRAEIVEGED